MQLLALIFYFKIVFVTNNYLFALFVFLLKFSKFVQSDLGFDMRRTTLEISALATSAQTTNV